ncbi:HAD family hydrolase [Massilia yuzhufengensis]|uniref:Haloacid dehalogenase superfamily, subfamily IA, variant 3 with third motif having DD or ED/beta-phosphoglucomutase family hydrolase n=1 Tax=Massilia yuzhufengensis TaxID=1164594 RepID=A0A1I1UAZ5_9BURK|nr:HAD family phosphatase [Massilia yuzhufengensis]SFD66748.1 haloacid dehalogenase superfamily, subfamily IA, variant 3 with third motif having DD or ED/haloacid dehalogenase superfamily, subfamily IA, variant 1 with third motif having Dx(3-4)D or Dx(3-4)E/beta-phosphoglucomutase family hydrolase [Massilia yuzhufengensis]
MTKAARAFVFDMDGTIVDNMAFHTSSWISFFARRGQLLDADDFFRATAGRQGGEIMRSYLGEHLSDDEVALLNHEKESVYRELYAPHRKAVAGFDELVAQAKADGVKLAVATAAPPANIDFTLDGLDVRKHFDAVVGAADVARGKPHPDVFLKAAERCGVAPEHCIVFEDAPLGVEAARRAGMRCIVLTTTLPAANFADYDNVIAIARDFSELPAALLFAAE